MCTYEYMYTKICDLSLKKKHWQELPLKTRCKLVGPDPDEVEEPAGRHEHARTRDQRQTHERWH